MKKVWKLPLIAWFLVTLGIGIAIGTVMYTLVIPGTITILPPEEGTYEIKVYSDADCTQEITSIDLGTAHVGDDVPFSFYVKNTGTITIPVIRMYMEISGVQLTTFGTTVKNLEIGQVRYVDLSIGIRADAGAGTYSLEFELECCA